MSQAGKGKRLLARTSGRSSLPAGIRPRTYLFTLP